MENNSYEYPQGLMDDYVRIILDNFCSWGKCFQGYGGCASRLPIFNKCKLWKIPKILKEIKEALKQNCATKFFLETPNFFDPYKMLGEDRFQFQELLTALGRKTPGAYFSVQATPRDLIAFLNDEDNNISPEFIRQAGVQEIWLGVESANAELREKYGKPYFINEKLEKAMLKLRSVGIECCFYLIASSDDTDETILETVAFVRRTKPMKICPFDAFHYAGGEHYVDWDNMRLTLEKVACYQTILKNLAEEVNCKS